MIGLVKGALPPDESKLAELVGPRGEKPPTKFLLMGTPDDKLFVDPKDRDDLPEIIDDLDPVPPVWKSTSDAIEQTQSWGRRRVDGVIFPHYRTAVKGQAVKFEFHAATSEDVAARLAPIS